MRETTISKNMLTPQMFCYFLSIIKYRDGLFDAAERPSDFLCHLPYEAPVAVAYVDHAVIEQEQENRQRDEDQELQG